MDYKKLTIDYYDVNSKQYEERTKDYLKKYLLDDAELFFGNLKGKNILDIGSGPGRDSLYFTERGFNPICIDMSFKMIKLCREKGLKSFIMDMENLVFKKNSFDGVWAYTSLLNTPKNKLSPILNEISKILIPKGIFYIGMKQGNFEGFQNSRKYFGIQQRFVSLYSDKELRQILSDRFEIIHSSKVTPDTENVYLNYLCEVKNARRTI